MICRLPLLQVVAMVDDTAHDTTALDPENRDSKL